MEVYKALEGSLLDRIKSIDELKGLDIDDYLTKFSNELQEKVKQAICCYGYTQIDDDEERRKIADKITQGFGDLIPYPYKLAWPIMRHIVFEFVLERLNDASAIGKTYCEGVECTLAPLAISY